MKRSKLTNITRVLAALVLAAAIWLPLLHLFFQPKLSDYCRAEGLAPNADAIAAFQLRIWSDPELRSHEIARMRGSNQEWDFMARTYFVLALANMGFRNPTAKNEYLEVIDYIIDETIRIEQERGILYFLMDYARDGGFITKPERSLFQDGEIALMLGVRRLLEEREDYKPLLDERIDFMVNQMKAGPVLCGESYPDECWMFCNAVALAAMRIADVLDGADHSLFFEEWIATAKEKLMDAETGLLISRFTYAGIAMEGPEGSSIWMVAHCLQVVDPAFARDQYDRAKKELAESVLGFGFAREWPRSWTGTADIDSGPVLPILEISAGSSGLALLGAGAFGDHEYLSALLTSLNFGGFPSEKKGMLRYHASNPVGDAVMLYAMVQGPVWEEVQRRAGL